MIKTQACRRTVMLCHSEERSGVGISGKCFEFAGIYRKIKNDAARLPRPLAGPRNDKTGSFDPKSQHSCDEKTSPPASAGAEKWVSSVCGLCKNAQVRQKAAGRGSSAPCRRDGKRNEQPYPGKDGASAGPVTRLVLDRGCPAARRENCEADHTPPHDSAGSIAQNRRVVYLFFGCAPVGRIFSMKRRKIQLRIWCEFGIINESQETNGPCGPPGGEIADE